VSVPSGRSELQRLADIDGDPIALGGGAIVATYQSDIAAVGQASGRVAWRRNLSSYSGMAADRQGIFVAADDGVVWGLDIRSGSAVWSQNALKHRKLSKVAVVGDRVVVGDFEGYLHWLNRSDGQMLARTRVGSDPITSGLQVVDGVLFVQGDGGELQAIRVSGNE